MSNIGYFSDIFHNLGELAIDLNDALNLLIRSYRTQVSEKEKEKAEKMLLSFLDLALEKGISYLPGTRDQQVKEILEAFLSAKKGTQSKLEQVRLHIASQGRLTKSEIKILDDLISQINQQATIAFRKMKKIM